MINRTEDLTEACGGGRGVVKKGEGAWWGVERRRRYKKEAERRMCEERGFGIWVLREREDLNEKMEVNTGKLEWMRVRM